MAAALIASFGWDNSMSKMSASVLPSLYESSWPIPSTGRTEPALAKPPVPHRR